MSYSIIRIEKIKSGTNTTGIQKHVQRENINYENEDIDHSKTHLNYDLVNDRKQNFNDLIDEKIERNYTGKRKIRKDAVKHIDGMITSDNKFFSNQTPADTKRFFEHAKEFLEQEYGKDNLLYATVHMDEKTPHMHFGIVPITKDGRLSAKDVVGNKKALTSFQDRFNEYVNERGYELERGTSRELTNRQHEQVSRYKQKTDYHRQEYEHESQKLDDIKQKNENMLQEYQKALDTLKTPLNVPYELEKEKVGGLFNKELQETGNVVISHDDFMQFQEQIKTAQLITGDYEYIKSGKALRDKDEQIQEKQEQFDELMKSAEKLKKNYKVMEEFTDNMKKAMELIKLLLKELERLLGRDAYAERINELTEDNSDTRKLASSIDRLMNPEYYPEEQKEEQQQRHRGMSR
ncbi:plasmid recombination protein [Klebsiella pneumoniae]|nr:MULTISPECIES: MobV family relaxase [Staphylococcus]MCP6558792.1 plasmid recombination protein [Klebsiella pneumoniae]MDK4121914.1 plasmid recombination protein [Staphylococcus pseudintermedius]MDN6011776.1 plasmid recombination protein [Lactococcus lactis]MCF0269785.1 plasmid recombination protein [Staphylococcus aureus]MCP6645855.1 plasmid recombination protein [Klebsiella pneumoniae]